MRRSLALLAAGAMLSGVVAAAPNQNNQSAAVDHNLELELGDSATITGSTLVGLNPENYATDYTCDGAPHHTCEVVLVKVTNPYEEENAKKGRERASLVLQLTPDVAASDYDVMVYESDEDGSRGPEVGAGNGVPISDHPESVETATVSVTTTEAEIDAYFLVYIVHWSTVGSYTLDAEFFA